MKSYRLFLTIFIGLGFSSFLLSQNKDQLFYDAVRSEASGDIASAISSYEKALKLGYSSKLYGNLGNLYFKIKQYGHSILCYRKALILSPSNREISANLDFAREIAGVKSVGLRSVDILGMNIENFWLISVILVFWSNLNRIFHQRKLLHFQRVCHQISSLVQLRDLMRVSLRCSFVSQMPEIHLCI